MCGAEDEIRGAVACQLWCGTASQARIVQGEAEIDTGRPFNEA